MPKSIVVLAEKNGYVRRLDYIIREFDKVRNWFEFLKTSFDEGLSWPPKRVTQFVLWYSFCGPLTASSPRFHNSIVVPVLYVSGSGSCFPRFLLRN